MFKGFQNNRRSNGFNGFPALNFQMNNEAYGFSGCTFWLDAAYGTNTQTDLAAVSTWVDKIRNIQFEQTTAGSQPRFILSDPNFNNLPSIQNIDALRWMTSNLKGGVDIGTNFTFVWVGKVDTYGGYNNIMGESSTKAANPFYTIGAGGTDVGNNGFMYYANGAVRLQGTTETTTPRICIMTGINVMVNGIIETTGSISSDYSATLTFFGRNGSTPNANIGRTAEIIYYKYNMTSTQLTDLSTRINSKYAIY